MHDSHMATACEDGPYLSSIHQQQAHWQPKIREYSPRRLRYILLLDSSQDCKLTLCSSRSFCADWRQICRLSRTSIASVGKQTLVNKQTFTTQENLFIYSQSHRRPGKTKQAGEQNTMYPKPKRANEQSEQYLETVNHDVHRNHNLMALTITNKYIISVMYIHGGY